jgi:ankyrin repeat protein
MDVFHWILDTKFENPGAITSAVTLMLPTIIESLNFEALITAIDVGLDLNSTQWLPACGGLIGLTGRGSMDLLRFIELFAPSVLRTSAAQDQLLSVAAAIGHHGLLDIACSECDPFDIAMAAGVALRYGHVDIGRHLLDAAGSDAVASMSRQIVETVALTPFQEVFKVVLPAVDMADDLTNAVELAVGSANFEFAQHLIDVELSRHLDAPIGPAILRALALGDLTIVGHLRSCGIRPIFSNLESAVVELSSLGYRNQLDALFSFLPPSVVSRVSRGVLQSVIECGDPEIALFLLAQASPAPSALHTAARFGKLSIVKALIDADPSLEFLNSASAAGSALCQAAGEGHVEVVSYLLKLPGIDPWVCDTHHANAFVLAGRAKSLPVLRLLADAGGEHLHCNAVIVNSAFLAAFHLDSESFVSPRFWEVSDSDLIAFFMNFPAFDVNFFASGTSALLSACKCGDSTLVRTLLKVPNVNPNIRDEVMQTPLMLAAQSGHLEAVRLLAECPGTQIEATSFHQETALSLAAASGWLEIVSYLIGRLTPDFSSLIAGALIRALQIGGVDVIRFLCTLDFDINVIVRGRLNHRWAMHPVISTKPLSAVLVAAIDSDAQFLPFVIGHPRFDPTHPHATRALFAEIKITNLLGFQALITAGVSLRVRNKSNDSVLCYACFRHDLNIMRYIIDHRDFDPADQDVWRALAYAIQTAFAPGVAGLARFVDINRPLPRCPVAESPEPEHDPEHDQDHHAVLPAIGPNMRPLVAAVLVGIPDVVFALLDVEAIDVNVRAPDGKPVLFYALAKPQILDALCRRTDLDLNARDLAGNTVLHILCAKNLWSMSPFGMGLWGALNIPGQTTSQIIGQFRTLCEKADRKAVNLQGKTPWQVIPWQTVVPEPEEIEPWIIAVLELPGSDLEYKGAKKG